MRADDIKRCRRGRMAEPSHIQAPAHVDVPAPYDGMDTSKLLTLTYAGVEFVRQDADEEWMVRDGRIYEVRIAGTRYIPAPTLDFDDVEIN